MNYFFDWISERIEGGSESYKDAKTEDLEQTEEDIINNSNPMRRKMVSKNK